MRLSRDCVVAWLLLAYCSVSVTARGYTTSGSSGSGGSTIIIVEDAKGSKIQKKKVKITQNLNKCRNIVKRKGVKEKEILKEVI